MKKKRSKVRQNNHQNKVAMIGITLVVCILLGTLLYEGNALKAKISTNDFKTSQLEEQITSEEQRTDEISQQQEYMQSDEYLEKAAKDKLGLVKENEIIFKEEK